MIEVPQGLLRKFRNSSSTGTFFRRSLGNPVVFLAGIPSEIFQGILTWVAPLTLPQFSCEFLLKFLQDPSGVPPRIYSGSSSSNYFWGSSESNPWISMELLSRPRSRAPSEIISGYPAGITYRDPFQEFKKKSQRFFFRKVLLRYLSWSSASNSLGNASDVLSGSYSTDLLRDYSRMSPRCFSLIAHENPSPLPLNNHRVCLRKLSWVPSTILSKIP